MKFYFLLSFIALSFSASSQNESEKVYWEQDGLSWNDFKAAPDANSRFHANTNAGLSFAWGVKDDNGSIELTFDVISYFNPFLSWVKVDPGNDYLLKHEQLHFDITELHARKLRNKLGKLNPAILIQDPKKVLNRIYQEVEKERKIMQLQFDKDSRHSLDKDGEVRWQNFVRAELLKYEEQNT